MEIIKKSNNCEMCAYYGKEQAAFQTPLYNVTGYMNCTNDKLTEKEQTWRLYDLVLCEHWVPATNLLKDE